VLLWGQCFVSPCFLAQSAMCTLSPHPLHHGRPLNAVHSSSYHHHPHHHRWSGPYLKRMIESVKATHPSTPLTLYANGSGGLLERLGGTGADVVGLDWTVDMADARQRLGSKSVQVRCC